MTTILNLSVSGDQYDGDPEFIVSVDGVQVGGPYDVSASFDTGAFQTVAFNANITPTSVITVTYINDASGPGGDRNLYVGSLTVGDHVFAGNVAALGTNGFLTDAGALWTDGSLSFSLAAPTVSGVPATQTIGGTEPIDPFAGVSITDTAAAPSDSAELLVTSYNVLSDADGTLSGAGLTKVSAGTYTLAATSPALLAAELAALVFTPAAQQSGTATSFELIASGAASATTILTDAAAAALPPATTTDTIVINAAGDQYEGDPAFTVSINGVQVGGPYYVSTLYSSGTFQQFSLSGEFGIKAGSTVSVNYINDASGPGGDRNLYVGPVVIDGQTYQGSVAALGTDGVLSNAGALWTDGSLSFTVADAAVSDATGMAAGQLRLVGVNLSGQEQLTLPDTYPTDGEIAYYASKGLNVIRLPIAWERIQPTLGGALSPGDLSQVQRVVSYANSLGVAVDIDLHNYGDYDSQPIGSAAVPVSEFVNFWSQMATQFTGANVMFGLMNEPALAANAWLSDQNDAIAAIRAAGATSQTILISGVDYDTASTWLTSGNATTYSHSIVDPDNNYAFEVHQYFDADGSGVSGDTVSATVGQQDLASITQWAQQNGARLFLGEFGSNSDPQALTNLGNTLSYMAQNSGVWLGGTEWEASTLYNYYFNVAPVNGVDSPQITVLDQYAPGTQAPASPAPTPASPAITGVAATQTLTDLSALMPFAGVAVDDASAGAVVSAVLTLTAAGVASDANGMLSGPGLSDTGPGSYSLAAATPAALSTELAAVVFTPTAHEVVPGASVTTGLALTVSAPDAAPATASTTLLATASETAPTITGLAAATSLYDNGTAEPFSGAVVADPDNGAAVSATITLAASGTATDANGVLSGAGLVHVTGGDYMLAAASPSALTAELQALLFQPTEGQSGSPVTTGITLTVAEGTATTTAGSAVVTTPAGPPATSITLDLAEDYYEGNAQALITINGVELGGPQTIEALQSQGHYDALTFSGPFGAGAQSIAVTFTNDAYGGSPSLDRNLYVDSILVNGSAVPGSAVPLYTDGTASFTYAPPGTAAGLAAHPLASASSVSEVLTAH